MKNLWYTKEVNTSFLEAVDDVIFALKGQWFWVLTKINMKEKLKEKLDKDIEEYIILWACNPWLAHKALQSEYEIWLLLPCNVIVYEKNSKVFVSAIMPIQAMGTIDNQWVKEVAIKAEEKLKKVSDNIYKNEK